MKKKKDRGMTILIIALIAIGGVGVYFGLIYPRINNASYTNTTSIKVPTVQVSVVSASDGAARDIQANFTVEVDRSIQGSVTGKALNGYITEIMATLDYDRITGYDSVDYVKSEVKKRLVDYMDEEKLQGIYITNLDTSEELPPLNPSGDAQRNRVFDNLFSK